MQNLGRQARFLSLILLPACSSDAPVEPPGTFPSFALGVGECKPVDAGLVPGFTRRVSGCNIKFTIRGNPSNIPNLNSDIQAAAAVWNNALRSPQASGAPEFVYTTGSTASFTVSVNGNTAEYCGETSFSPAGIKIIPKTGATACKTNAGGITDVLTHEFAHVLGWTVGQHKARVAGYSSHCGNVLPDDGTLHGSVCQHDVERIYASYGITSLGVVQDPNFLGRHIITGVNTPPAKSLTTGGTVTLAATQLTFARALIGPQPLNGTVLNWSSDVPTVATVNSSGVVTARSAGTTKIRVKIASGFASNFLVGGLMRDHGKETVITVTDPPTPPPPPPPAEPGIGFRVTDITGVEPITSDGPYTFGVQVYNGGEPSTITVKWSFVASNGAFPPITTQYTSRYYTLNVPPGSYEIRVTATPRNQVASGGYVVGGSYIEDFTVCTGSGGGDPLRSRWQPGTKALPGC